MSDLRWIDKVNMALAKDVIQARRARKQATMGTSYYHYVCTFGKRGSRKGHHVPSGCATRLHVVTRYSTFMSIQERYVLQIIQGIVAQQQLSVCVSFSRSRALRRQRSVRPLPHTSTSSERFCEAASATCASRCATRGI
jgi:hypothetical protein